ncbi:MAG: hypothetical protein ACRDF0_10530 [Candidatus Limnocylindria bacterium]
MRGRELIFGAVAVLLLLGYVLVGARYAAIVGPADPPTPTPTMPARPVDAPRLPGAIAFVIRGDVFVLRDGAYAAQTSEGRSLQPDLSRDGRTLVFARQEQIDGRRIVDGQATPARLRYTSVMRKASTGGIEGILLDGLRLRQQSGFHLVSWYFGPAQSPDGARLAYVEDDGGGASDLVVLDIASRRRLVLTAGRDLADAAWSPDGRTIATTTYGEEGVGVALWSAERAAAPMRPTLAEGEAYSPSFSPDGRWLLYTLRRDGRNDLRAFELATGRDVALTDDGRSWHGAFSPDGRYVAFLREGGGSLDVHAMELGDVLSGGAPRATIRLTHGGVDGASRPSWGR